MPIQEYSDLIADKTAMPRRKSCSGILIQKSVGILEYTFGKISRPYMPSCI
ncbi:MAG: hypothetical protein MJ014_06125 [Methanocorpusculum sp.]|nr:hypothetical protein [Methanocorpusculum sp.]